jgi:hypothetical protein
MQRRNLQKALDFAAAQIRKEIIAQGHVATGNLLNSIHTEIEDKGDSLVGRVYIADYAGILDKGVSASRIPYSPGSGAGSSKYIDALVNWISTIKPGLSDTDKKSFAFAIANKAKKEGHPTRGSFAFSKNGRRTGWAKAAIQDKVNDVRQLLDLGPPIAALIRDMVNDINRTA